MVRWSFVKTVSNLAQFCFLSDHYVILRDSTHYWSVTRQVALNILSSSFVVGRAGCCKSLVIQCVALFPRLWLWVLRWMPVLITWIQILRMIRVGSKKQEVECSSSSKGWIRTGGWAALAFSSLLSHLVSAGDPTVCSVMHQQVHSTL